MRWECHLRTKSRSSAHTESSVHTNPGHLRTPNHGHLAAKGPPPTHTPTSPAQKIFTWGGGEVGVVGRTITFMSSLTPSAWHTHTHEHWDGLGWVGWGTTKRSCHLYPNLLGTRAHMNIGMGWGGVDVRHSNDGNALSAADADVSDLCAAL